MINLPLPITIFFHHLPQIFVIFYSFGLYITFRVSKGIWKLFMLHCLFETSNFRFPTVVTYNYSINLFRVFCQTHQLHTGTQYISTAARATSWQSSNMGYWPLTKPTYYPALGSHTTTAAYDKPIPNYAQSATNISIWLDTPLLSGGGIHTRSTAGKLGDVTIAHTTSLAGRKWRKWLCRHRITSWPKC